MTALDRYVRLESDALWRETPQAQRRDVVVAFGDATLVIADQAGRPLSHWSLTALSRKNPDTMPAIYVPDADDSEMLEIADPTMVGAIEEVRKALAKSRPHPGKLRFWLTGGVVVLAVLLAVLWLPGALMRQTLAVVPPAKRAEIGMTMVGHMQPSTGRVCQTTRAAAAGARLADRLFGPAHRARIVVVPRLAAGALALPGGVYLLDQGLLQQTDDPAVAAGYLLAARVASDRYSPLEELLRDAGLPTTLRLLTTGDIEDAILQATAPWLEVDGEMHGDVALDANARVSLMPRGDLRSP